MFCLALSSHFFTVSHSHALSFWDAEVWTLSLCNVDCVEVLPLLTLLTLLSLCPKSGCDTWSSFWRSFAVERYFRCLCEALYRGCVAAVVFLLVPFFFIPRWTPIVFVLFCICYYAYVILGLADLGVFVTVSICGWVLIWDSLSWMVWLMKKHWKTYPVVNNALFRVFIKVRRFLFTQKWK